MDVKNQSTNPAPPSSKKKKITFAKYSSVFIMATVMHTDPSRAMAVNNVSLAPSASHIVKVYVAYSLSKQSVLGDCDCTW